MSPERATWHEPRRGDIFIDRKGRYARVYFTAFGFVLYRVVD